jgi:hypothetical protein
VSPVSTEYGPSRPPLGTFAHLATALPFAALSALRRARIFHPRGVAFDATLTVDAAAPPLAGLERGDHRAVVRLSRGAGVPESWPDVLGIALKLPDVDERGGDQDFLFVTSGQQPVLRHLLLPTRSFTGQTYSTLLPFQVGTERVLFGLEAVDLNRMLDLADLRATDDASDVCFILTMAAPAGPWAAIGELQLGERIPDKAEADLRFNPWNDAAGIRPFGVLNTLRAGAYPGSQRGRDLTSRRL